VGTFEKRGDKESKEWQMERVGWDTVDRGSNVGWA